MSAARGASSGPGVVQGGSWPTMDEEQHLEALFAELHKLYGKLEKQKNPDKITSLMNQIVMKLKDCKRLLKDFERQARSDGMPSELLTQRKKPLAHELNQLIDMKKRSRAFAERSELLEGAAGPPKEENLESMSNQQLISKGRDEIREIDNALGRAARIAEDTEAVGRAAAEGLHDQGQQLNRIENSLADMEFNLKKASKVIADITRGMLTDKCIGALLVLAAVGVIVIIVLKVVKPNQKDISSGIDSFNNATGVGDLISQGINAATSSVSSGVSSAAGQLPGAKAPGRRLLQ